MKKSIQLLSFIFCSLLFCSCDNDDGNATNQNACNYQGLSYVDSSNNNQTLIPEADLTTDFFPNNGGPGIPAVEIFNSGSSTGFSFFTTSAVTLNATGAGTIGIGGTNYACVVTCQLAGTNVGDDFRFDISIPNVGEAEFCVIIDSVNP